MPKKKVKKLPQRIIPLKNADKTFHEKWKKKDSLFNFCAPFRMVLAGPPNVGKSTMIKHILLHQDPPFEEVVVVHCDPENTAEYDDLGGEDCNVTITDQIPHPSEWSDQNTKTLCIIDDLELKHLSKQQKSNLDRAFGFCSTHKNVNICLAVQDVFNIVPSCRRMSNIWVLWKNCDLDSLANIARKCGMLTSELKAIFKNLMPNFRDSLMIDMSPRSPAPLRKNGFEIIQKE